MSRREALRVAQYPENTAPNRVTRTPPSKRHSPASSAESSRSRVAQVIAEGVQATETKILSAQRQIMEQREVIAWGLAQASPKIAAEYGSYVEPGCGVSISTRERCQSASSASLTPKLPAARDPTQSKPRSHENTRLNPLTIRRTCRCVLVDMILLISLLDSVLLIVSGRHSEFRRSPSRCRKGTGAGRRCLLGEEIF